MDGTALPDSSTLSMPELRAQITELAGHLNAAQHRWLVLIAEFDRRQGWSDGATQSCAHWLNWQCGLDMGAAREKVRVAHALEKLPRVAAAMERGALSYSKVRALSRVADEATEEYFLDIALHGTANHVEKLVRGYRRAQEAEELSREARQQAARGLSYFYDTDGSLILRGNLPAEVGALFIKALDAAMQEPEKADGKVGKDRKDGNVGNVGEEGKIGAARAEPLKSQSACNPQPARSAAMGNVSTETSARSPAVGNVSAETSARSPAVGYVSAETSARSPAVGYVSAETSKRSPAVGNVSAETSERPRLAARRADALGRIAESFLTVGPAALNGGERHQIVVHVDAQTLQEGVAGRCELDDGPSLPVETVRRLACDASVVSVMENEEGEPLNIGRKTRTIPPAIRRALNARDRGCRFPGCTNTQYVDAHHIHHWSKGGETKLSNLALLCRFHHRQVHEGRVEVQVLNDGALRFLKPDGQSFESVAPEHTEPMDWRELSAQHREQGIHIDEDTASTLWRGEVMDYGLGVQVLLHKADRARRNVSAES